MAPSNSLKTITRRGFQRMTSIRIGNTVIERGNKTAEEIKADLLRAKNQRLLNELDTVIAEFESEQPNRIESAPGEVQ